MTKKIKVSELPEFDAAELLNSEEDMAAYLTTILEENDPALLTTALGHIARAHGTIVCLPPIHEEADYDKMVALMNSLLDEIGKDEEHALASLLELVGDVISKYESANYAIE